jgi:hypothetical protein
MISGLMRISAYEKKDHQQHKHNTHTEDTEHLFSVAASDEIDGSKRPK